MIGSGSGNQTRPQTRRRRGPAARWQEAGEGCPRAWRRWSQAPFFAGRPDSHGIVYASRVRALASPSQNCSDIGGRLFSDV